MFHILNILHQLGHRVTFVPDNLANISPYEDELQKRGIEIIYHPYFKKVRDYLVSHGPEFDAVVLSRCDFARKHIADTRLHAPRSRIIFDTVDLHFVRTGREAQITSDPETREKARQKEDLEYELIDQADETWVVSSVEQSFSAKPGHTSLLRSSQRLPISRARRPRSRCGETGCLSAGSSTRQTSMRCCFSCRKFIRW